MKHVLNFALVFAVVVNCFAQKIKPALNLTKGATYYMVVNSNSAVTQILNGQGNSFNQTLNYKIAFKVISIKDTLYQIDASYQSASMRLEGSGQLMELNSKRNDPQDIPSSIMAAITNKPFKIGLTKAGSVTSVESIGPMLDNIFNSYPQIDTAKKEQVTRQLMQTFGPAAFKRVVETATAVFPKVPILATDKWAVTTTLENPAKTIVHIDYQLMAVTGGYYQIYGEGTMMSDKNAKPSILNGLPVMYDLTGTNISDVKADQKTGWVSDVKSKQAIRGSMQIPDRPQVPGGMTIPMIFSTDIEITDK